MYTIGQISEMFHLPVSTLRYYDKEGLFPFLERSAGIRRFSDTEIEALHVIECLKKSGMEIRDIKQFMDWCQEGPSTYGKRKRLFEARKKALEEQLQELQKNMAMVEFKCWYYEQAIADGNEDRLDAIIPDALPEEIRKKYELGFGKQE